MDATHLAALGTLLDTMARIYHHPLETDDKLAYLLALDDLSLEAVQYACKQVFRSETFMPVPAIVRSYAKDWQQKQRILPPSMPDAELLALREAMITPEEIHQLIQSALPGYGWEPPQEEATDAAD